MAATRKERSEISFLLKYVLFGANFLFLVVGGVTWCFGAWSISMEPVNIRTVTDFLFNPRVIVMMVIGLATFLIAFFGCCGSLREETICLKCYHITITIFLGLELVLLVLFFVLAFAPDVLVNLNIYPQDQMKDAIVNYGLDPDQTELVDFLQKTFECCGVSNDDEGYLDWNANPYYNCSKDNPSHTACAVPFTCCVLKVNEINNLLCGAGALDQNVVSEDININKVGCLKGMVTLFQNNLYVILGIVFGILIPQLIFIHFSKNLCSQIKQQKAKWERSPYARDFD